ncbi:MAG TPA: tol-pal system protein YbgF [Devosia sp.]|nr:tol-pal system protein YbgF [Devosia sp.]
MRLSLPMGARRGLTAFAIALSLGVFAPEMVAAQSRNEAELIVRIQSLEDSVRTLTGQVEELQHTIDVLKQQLTTQQEDYEFRFQQLEGGAGKKPEAAAQPSGATPEAALPQADTAIDTTQLPPPAPLDGETATAPDDGLGESADPLIGSNNMGGGTLGTLDPNAVDARPLDLTLPSDQALSDGDANAQYAAAYDAIVRGDYPFAEDQLRQFINLYPDDPQAPDAINWLGEALLQQGKYEDAADILTTGFQKYGKSPRVPDILLRLGIALNGADQNDAACRTFFELSKRYPNQPAAFKQKLKAEQAAAQCAVT